MCFPMRRYAAAQTLLLLHMHATHACYTCMLGRHTKPVYMVELTMLSASRQSCKAAGAVTERCAEQPPLEFPKVESKVDTQVAFPCLN